MTLDGIQGVQARIQEINQIIANATSASGSASSSSDANASSSAATSPEFASLLEDAMASSASGDGSSASSNPLAALTGLTGGTAASGSSSLLSELTSLLGGTQSASPVLGTSPMSTTQGTYGSSPTAQAFLQTALAQQGKQYIYGADPSPTNANPTAFDCEGLTKWAAARVGIDIPAGATFQYRYVEQHGTTMSVDQALHTPGALLFHFGTDPNTGVPADGHVGISVGDGVHVMEAKGHAYGTNVFADASHFNYAGMIPGM